MLKKGNLKGVLIEHNIRISLLNGCFKVQIYSDDTLATEANYLYFHANWCWNKVQRKKNKELKKKHREIRSYIEDTETYKKTLKTYNLLPIKEQRRRKLEELKNKT